ncbi:hypothetical protein A9O66_24740 [Paraburkholderia caribensis]|uniref:Uncharacterized protein n=1 Tax=Paraburkholderia caribensis TaxID=75105 RepID=A0A9Q6S6V3_9BURK|nr:hypothetical protein A9O66_24740 [Paraburkholderia caribensis]
MSVTDQFDCRLHQSIVSPQQMFILGSHVRRTHEPLQVLIPFVRGVQNADIEPIAIALMRR